MRPKRCVVAPTRWVLAFPGPGPRARRPTHHFVLSCSPCQSAPQQEGLLLVVLASFEFVC